MFILTITQNSYNLYKLMKTNFCTKLWSLVNLWCIECELLCRSFHDNFWIIIIMWTIHGIIYTYYMKVAYILYWSYNHISIHHKFIKLHRFVQKSYKYIYHFFNLKPTNFAWTYYFTIFTGILLKFHDIVSLWCCYELMFMMLKF